MKLLRQAVAVLRKDLVTELRTREVVVTLVFFAVLVAILGSVAFFVDERETRKVAAGVIWTAIPFAGVLGLVRVFGREREWDAWSGLVCSAADPVAIYLGKTAFTFLLLTAVEVVLVPIVAILFHLSLATVLAPLVLLLALGTFGFAVVGTLFGVLTVRTRARDLVLAVVLLPLLLPALLPCVGATRDLFDGAPIGDLLPWIRIVAAYDVLSFVGALWTFGTLAEG